MTTGTCTTGANELKEITGDPWTYDVIGKWTSVAKRARKVNPYFSLARCKNWGLFSKTPFNTAKMQLITKI